MKSYADLHDYQKNSITELYERPYVLGSLPTGAGKTVIGLTAFQELRDAGEVRQGVIVGTQRIAISVWPQEPDEWGHLQDMKVLALAGTPKQRLDKLGETADLYSLSFNNIKWLKQVLADRDDDDPIFDLLIIDESSFLKDPKGVWGKTIQSLRSRFRNVWMLTGSPRPNSLLDFYRPMSILTSNRLWGRSYYKWRQQYFYPTDFNQYNWTHHAFAEEQIMRDVAAHAFKVPMEAVPRPASDPIIHEIELPPEARQMYKTMERELMASVTADDGAVDVVAFNSAVASGKLAQIAQGFIYDDVDDEKTALPVHDKKIDVLSELLATNEGLSSVIVYWFNEDLERIKQAHPDVATLGGDTTEQEGLAIEKDWNAGKIKKLALHPASAGHGLNLQKVKAQLIHYCITWSAELYMQVIARVARQGYAGGADEWFVLNHLIVAKDTVDELKISRVAGKVADEQASLDYVSSVSLGGCHA